MLQVLSLLSALLVLSKADIADDRTVVSVSRVSSSSEDSLESRLLQVEPTSPSFVDVRLVPGMLASRLDNRRLKTEETVTACLSDGVAVESLSTLEVQVINTASASCNVTREEMCQYLTDAAETLRLDVLCEPNYAVELNFGSSRSALRELLGVNDTFAGKQWNLASIGMKEAWQALKGRPLREVVVAVVDTGVDFRHEDLAGNIFSYENCSHGYNFHDNNDDVSDAELHGTAMAGILGAVTNNGIGVAGIAPVKIMPVRVLGSLNQGPTGSDGSAADIMKGLNYAVDNGADLSTHSYSSRSDSRVLRSAMKRAAERGHLIVAPAGNSGSDISVNKRYPCAWTKGIEMLCVASSDGKGQLASHSNYAPYVDIAAPGELILTTKPNNGYAVFSGTSVAVPHVTGAAALLFGMGLLS
ncbi:Suppressor of the cold-sensitive snRNP bioproteinsis mutant brr1-1 [Perkinsus olseni]|uniref:subtilisin n=1 Tax=Perkinsus olseni TaxID=32597 RepID=A0A7J6NVQ2_PEROL|nr:Suppressor of the cold-sensitive snRNP bioproteinsis mutant brr1-1 [Perkinsus olseni]KAF4711461.1 Suppressor of the cold-sensitive snRNP bioproteinsis mutant brr1-1 [Perkinsus olseni]